MVANIFFWVFFHVAQAVVCVGPGPSTAATECFDVPSWSWKTLPFSLPSPTGYRASIDLGGMVCLAGGFSGSASAAVHCLNYSSPAWHATPSLYLQGGLQHQFTVQVGSGSLGSPRQVPLTWSAVVDSGFVDGDYPIMFTWNGTTQANGKTSAAKLVKTSATTWAWQSGPPVLFPGRQAATIVYNPANGLPCAIGGASILGSLLLGPDNGPSCLVPNSSGGYGWEAQLSEEFPAYPISIYYARNISIAGLSCIAGGSDGSVARKEVYCLNGSNWTRLPDMAVARSAFTTFNYPTPAAPTPSPTFAPTASSTTLVPTSSPTAVPTTLAPSLKPTLAPTSTPLAPTSIPTVVPTSTPTLAPSLNPTVVPTSTPTLAPSLNPTLVPTSTPTLAPSLNPTVVPTSTPTLAPSLVPTSTPTLAPSLNPTLVPTSTPTAAPTSTPTVAPTGTPTVVVPTSTPTLAPTSTPTLAPTSTPTLNPTTSSLSSELIMNYAETAAVSQWMIFQCTSYVSSRALAQLLWSFSNGVKMVGSIIALPPFTFAIGDVTFNVTNGVTVASNSFTVVGSVPVVLVTGGNTEVTSGSSLTLHADASYDPNIPNSTSTNLDYNWTVDGTPCGVNSPSLIVSTANIPPLTTRTFKLNATSRLTSLWAVVTVELRVVASPMISNITISGPNVVCVSNQLRLLASVTNLGKLSSFDWSVQPTLPLSPSSSCKLPPGSSLASNRALVLRGECMEQGTTYRFTFTVRDSSMNAAQSWVDVAVAHPPSGGNCMVSSQTGVALTTVFHIECTGWMDSIGSSSLTYSLKRNMSISTGSGSMTVLAALSPRQYQGTFYVALNSNDGNGGSPLNGQLTTSVDVQLIVVISGDGGDIQWNLNPITLAPLQQCPTNASARDDAQYLTTIIGSNELHLCGKNSATTGWQTLWNEVSQIINNLDYIDADNMAFLARSLRSLASAAQSGSVTTPLNFTVVLSDLVEKLLSVGESTEISTQTTLGALPDPVSCDVLQLSLLSALQQKLADLGEGRLPGEAPVVLQTPQKIAGTTATFFSDEAESMGSASISIGLPTELLDRGGAISQVTVIDYGEALMHCRMGSNQPISSVVDVTLLSNDRDARSNKAVSVQGLNEGFSFSTQVTGDASCGKPVCAWWQPSTLSAGGGEDGKWSRDGCFTVGSTPDAPANVTCTCTHLTEFSLILRPGCVNATYRALYYLSLAGYITIFIVIVTKVSYCQWKVTKQTSEDKKKQTYVVLWQHLLLAILCIARIAACAILAADIQEWNIADRAVVLLIPFMIEFWVLTLVVFQWASIHPFGTQVKNPLVRVRALFILTNILVVASIIATIAVISSAAPSFSSATLTSTSSQSRAETVVVVAAGAISVVTFFMAASFLGYAIPLYRNLKGSDNVGTRQVLIGALVLCSLLLLQSFLHLATAVGRRGQEAIVGGDASEVVELIVDIFCVVTLLALYHQSLHNTSSVTAKQGQKTSTNSTKTDTKINLDTIPSLVPLLSVV